MKVLSTTEVSNKWNISNARIRKLAEQGRIEGAQLVGNNWLIPEDAAKPADKRLHKENSSASCKSFRFPLTIFGNYSDTETAQLSIDEKKLHQAQINYGKCEFEKAKSILAPLVKTTKSIQVKIGSLYFLCFTYLHTREYKELNNCLFTLRFLFESDFENKKELQIILEDLLTTFNESRKNIIKNKLDFSIKFSKGADSFIFIYETCRQLTYAITNNTFLNPNLFEFACTKFEDDHYLVSAMYLHHYIGTMYQVNKDIVSAKAHFRKAITLAIETKCFAPLLGLSFANFELYESLLGEFPKFDKEKAISFHRRFVEDYALYLEQRGSKSYYKNVSDEDLKFINHILLGTMNKKIAKLEGISESTVNKKLMVIYTKLNVSGKKDLYKLVVSSILDKQ